jgi:hypothetical protein
MTAAFEIVEAGIMWFLKASTFTNFLRPRDRAGHF